MIRVLLADDQHLVREGFARLLRDVDDMEVVGEAADGDQAVSLARSSRPDVVLMDVRMPGTDGIEATRAITRDLPATRVLVLTTFDLDEAVHAALGAGRAASCSRTCRSTTSCSRSARSPRATPSSRRASPAG